MKNFSLALFIALLSSCLPDKPSTPEIKITKSSFIDGRVELEGENFNSVTLAKIESENNNILLNILEKSATKLVLNAQSSGGFKVGDVFNLILENANGQNINPLQVTVPDGSITLEKLDLNALDDRYAGATPGDGAITCPPNYILVPGDELYKTKDFCVMKYEARSDSSGVTSKPEGLPLRGMVSQLSAMGMCQNLGANYGLINNFEWMTIGANIVAVGSNWSSGTVGDGSVNRGHTDGAPADVISASSNDEDACFETGQSCTDNLWNDQRRTHVLSNGEIIWDFSGNAWEWVSWQVFEGKIGPSSSWRKISSFTQSDDTEHMKLSDIRPVNTTHPFWNDAWDELQGFGRYAPFHQQAAGAAMRGGSVFNGIYSGVFSLNLSLTPTTVDRVTGFRCVYRKHSQ